MEAELIVPDVAWEVYQRSEDVDPPSGLVTVQLAPTSNHNPVGVVVSVTEAGEPNWLDWKAGADGVPPPATV